MRPYENYFALKHNHAFVVDWKNLLLRIFKRVISISKDIWRDLDADGGVFHSRSREDTFALARDMAQNAKPGGIICLSGDLGSGKTVFAKGFAAGLGIGREVVSPTFTILIEYPIGTGIHAVSGGEGARNTAVQRLPMYHFDAYRLGERPDDPAAAAAFEDIGGDEYLFGDGVCLIEWAEIIRTAIPENACWVEISRCGGDENEREIIVKPGWRDTTCHM